MNRLRKIALMFLGVAVLLLGTFAVAQVGQHRRERELAETLALYQRMAGEDEGALTKARGKVSEKDIPTLLKWLNDGNGPAWRKEWERKLYTAIARSDEELLRKHHLPELAVCGFEVLGTNGAPAIPALVARAKEMRSGFRAIEALVSIGEPAWETADRLAKSRESRERRFAAYIMGVLGIRTNESVEFLLGLARDADEKVRFDAYRALEEFRCERSDKVFIARLQISKDDEEIKRTIYALADGGTNALRTLVRVYDETSDHGTRHLILERLLTRRTKRLKTIRERKDAYEMRYIERFIGDPFESTDRDALWSAVRDNILTGGEPNLHEEYREQRFRADKELMRKRDEEAVNQSIKSE
jgi:hypothetical protein